MLCMCIQYCAYTLHVSCTVCTRNYMSNMQDAEIKVHTKQLCIIDSRSIHACVLCMGVDGAPTVQHTHRHTIRKTLPTRARSHFAFRISRIIYNNNCVHLFILLIKMEERRKETKQKMVQLYRFLNSVNSAPCVHP